MASVYTNDLRLEEIGSGEQSGSWGDTTNTNLELIAEAFSFGTEAITTNANTHTTTIADGATDAGRSMFLKYTGTLDSACTITIGPNTVSKLWFIENGTSGSQNIIIKQGSGATITIPPGDTKAIYSNGAGSGAAMVDAFASLSVVDLKVQDDLTVTDDAAIGGILGVTGIATFTDDIIIGDGKTIGSASTVGAITIASDGDLAFTGVVTANAGVVVDNFTLDGTTLALSSGDFTVDVAGDIILDAGGSDILLKVAGTTFGSLRENSSNFRIKSDVNNKDIVFLGVDGGGEITALTLDMSDGGAALFNSHVRLGDGNSASFGAGNDLEITSDGTNGTIAAPNGNLTFDGAADITIDCTDEINLFQGGTPRGVITMGDAFVTFGSSNNNGDVRIMGIDGGAGITALEFDMSDAGTATFNHDVVVDTGSVIVGSTSNEGFDLNCLGQAKFHNGGSDAHGQIRLTGSSGGDAQLSMNTDSNGRHTYLDESDSNTLRFSGGNGKNHSSDLKLSNVGNLAVGGALSKASGSFKIRHPLEAKKNTHYLVHSFVEGPQADNLYRGKVDLISGSATQNIDTVAGMSEGTFDALNREVQCFTTNESGWTAIKGSVSGNILTITAQESSCTDTISWMVIGERKDPHMMSVHTDWTDSDGKIIIEPELTDEQKSENTEYDPDCGC